MPTFLHSDVNDRILPTPPPCGNGCDQPRSVDTISKDAQMEKLRPPPAVKMISDCDGGQTPDSGSRAWREMAGTEQNIGSVAARGVGEAQTKGLNLKEVVRATPALKKKVVRWASKKDIRHFYKSSGIMDRGGAMNGIEDETSQL